MPVLVARARPPEGVARLNALIDDIEMRDRARITAGSDAAHIQDFLYDENGLPD